MRKMPMASIPGLFLTLICLLPLHAQTAITVPVDANPPAIPAPAAQAPDEATKRITELVHAGKYAEAQKLTAGLLIAYPDDQRLVKAKVLIDEMLSPARPASAPAVTTQPDQPAAGSNNEQLSGMDKVDYNALIVLARQAQQTADLGEQRKLLQQFMNQSAVFLGNHPNQMLLWQLRAQLAISLNEPMDGYEAGQKLLAAGAADSNDPVLQQLLGQLKNKGWLDQEEAARQDEKAKDYLSILGTWGGRLSWADHRGHEVGHSDFSVEFSKTDSVIEGYVISANGTKKTDPWLRGTILDSGEVSWQRRWRTDWKAVSVDIGNDKRTMKVGFSETIAIGQNAFNTAGYPELCAYAGGYTKQGPLAAVPETHAFAAREKSGEWPSGQSLAGKSEPSSRPGASAAQGSAPIGDAGPSVTVSSGAPGTAILHVYRLKHFAGSAVSYGVYVDDKKIVPVGNGESIRMLVGAGKHSVSIAIKGAKTRKPINDLDMAAGQEYWVRVDLGAGFPMDYFIVTLVPGDQAEAESGKLEEIKMGELERN